MKKVVIIRFGPNDLTPIDLRILGPFSHGKSFATTFGTIGVISIIETNAETSEIAQLFNEANERLNNKFPSLVFEVDDKLTGVNIGGLTDRITELLKQFEPTESEKFVEKLTMDELLEIIHRKGIDALTPEMKAKLDKLSKKE